MIAALLKRRCGKINRTLEWKPGKYNTKKTRGECFLKKIFNSVKCYRDNKKERDWKVSARFGIVVRVTGKSSFRAWGVPRGCRPEWATIGEILYVSSMIKYYKMVSYYLWLCNNLSQNLGGYLNNKYLLLHMVLEGKESRSSLAGWSGSGSFMRLLSRCQSWLQTLKTWLRLKVLLPSSLSDYWQEAVPHWLHCLKDHCQEAPLGGWLPLGAWKCKLRSLT